MPITFQEAKGMLIKLLETSEPETTKKVYAFQDFIWHHEPDETEEDLCEILDDLALDLDDYEPNSEVRKECRSFYGEEKLIQNIQEALEAINLWEIKNQNEQKDQD